MSTEKLHIVRMRSEDLDHAYINDFEASNGVRTTFLRLVEAQEGLLPDSSAYCKAEVDFDSDGNIMGIQLHWHEPLE